MENQEKQSLDDVQDWEDKITSGQSEMTLEVQAQILRALNVLKPHLTKLSLSAESIAKLRSIVTSTPVSVVDDIAHAQSNATLHAEARSKRATTHTRPRRRRWNKHDTSVFCLKFKEKTRPGKAAIRLRIGKDNELKMLMIKNGFERCYEKVKTIYKQRAKSFKSCKHAWCLLQTLMFFNSLIFSNRVHASIFDREFGTEILSLFIFQILKFDRDQALFFFIILFHPMYARG